MASLFALGLDPACRHPDSGMDASLATCSRRSRFFFHSMSIVAVLHVHTCTHVRRFLSSVAARSKSAPAFCPSEMETRLLELFVESSMQAEMNEDTVVAVLPVGVVSKMFVGVTSNDQVWPTFPVIYRCRERPSSRPPPVLLRSSHPLSCTQRGHDRNCCHAGWAPRDNRGLSRDGGALRGEEQQGKVCTSARRSWFICRYIYVLSRSTTGQRSVQNKALDWDTYERAGPRKSCFNG